MYNRKFYKQLISSRLPIQVFTKNLKNGTNLRIVIFNMLKISVFRCCLAGVCVQNVNALTLYVRGLKAVGYGKRCYKLYKRILPYNRYKPRYGV